ncbi:MAG: transposase, partial [Dehalococcoidia bacterium]
LYGYATGVFSSRQLEQATYESVPFRFLAGGLHPDHDTIAHFRTSFLAELQAFFVEALLLAQAVGLLQLGDISLDGTKVRADASKSKAVSYKRAGELIAQLEAEVAELFALVEQADQAALPAGVDVAAEIARREERLARLAEAKAVLEARAKERDAQEQAAYAAKVREREEKTRRTGRKPRGRPPTPPTPGPRDTDQYNFHDPKSRIMKNPTNAGFDQHYNAQLAVDQASLFIVGQSVSAHPTDQDEVVPTVESMPAQVGTPTTGLWTPATSARRTSAPSNSGALTPTLPPAAPAITRAGGPTACRRWLCPLQRTPVPRRRWPTNCRPQSVAPSIVGASAPSSLSLAASKRCAASASSPYAG